jgi:hypothetical protein
MHSRWFALSVLLSVPAAVCAQTSADSSQARTRGRFELTPTVSYNFGGVFSGGGNTRFDLDLEAADSEAYGVSFGFPLSPRVQIELLASRQRTRLDAYADYGGANYSLADFEVTYYHVGGLFQWGNGQIHPFGVASLGIASLNPDLRLVQGAYEENKFSGSIGGGVKIFFTDSIGLRLEGRGFWTLLDSNNTDIDWGDDCYRCGHDYAYSDTFDQVQTSVGLIIAW